MNTRFQGLRRTGVAVRLSAVSTSVSITSPAAWATPNTTTPHAKAFGPALLSAYVLPCVCVENFDALTHTHTPTALFSSQLFRIVSHLRSTHSIGHAQSLYSCSSAASAQQYLSIFPSSPLHAWDAHTHTSLCV